MTPDTLLRLANLTVPRKPGRGPAIYPDPLAGPATAAHALGLRRLDTSELGTLRELHKTIVELVDGLLSRRPVARPAARLTKLAQPSAGDGTPRRGRKSDLARAAGVERTHAHGHARSPGRLGTWRDRRKAPEALRAARVPPRLLRHDAIGHAALACRIAMRSPRATTTLPRGPRPARAGDKARARGPARMNTSQLDLAAVAPELHDEVQLASSSQPSFAQSRVLTRSWALSHRSAGSTSVVRRA